jgi:hypothetical protein
VNIDETSYPDNKKLARLWVFVTSTFAFFTIQASRGSKVIKQFLGDLFDGIIICDRFSAYVKYHKDRACGLIQFCLYTLSVISRRSKMNLHIAAYNADKPFSVLMRQRIGTVFRLWHAHGKNQEYHRHDFIKKYFWQPVIQWLFQLKDVMIFCFYEIIRRFVWKRLFRFRICHLKMSSNKLISGLVSFRQPLP